MPPAMFEKCYAFRITHTFERLTDIFDELLKHAEGLLVVEHKEEGKRTHIHAALLNATVSHKRLKQIIQARYSGNSATVLEEIKGAGNFSLKKWDTMNRYLVYMLKGKYTFLYNRLFINGKIGIWISSEEEERLRLLWKSESIAENEYSEFKASKYWPFSDQDKTDSINAWLNDATSASPPKTTTSFDTVKAKVIEFILAKYGGFITAKNRFLIKDLISNVCLFNDIKMLPLYI